MCIYLSSQEPSEVDIFASHTSQMKKSEFDGREWLLLRYIVRICSQCQPALVAFSETPGKEVRLASVLCSQVRGKIFEKEGQVLWDHRNRAGTMTQAIRGDFLEEVMVTLPE